MRNTKIEINTVRINVSKKDREEIEASIRSTNSILTGPAAFLFLLFFLVTKNHESGGACKFSSRKDGKKVTDLFLLFTQSSYLRVIVVRPFPLTLPF